METVIDEDMIDNIFADADPTLDDSVNIDLSDALSIGDDAEGVEDSTSDGTSSGVDDVPIDQSTMPDDTTIETEGEETSESEDVDVPTEITDGWQPVNYTFGPNDEFVNLDVTDDLVDGDTSNDDPNNEV